MIEFRNYIEEKNLDESVLGTIALVAGTALAGITALAWLGTGISWILTAWGKNSIRAFRKTKELWKSLGKEISDEQIKAKLDKVSNSPEAKKQLEKMEKVEEKYFEELSGVYKAIEEKDWSLAAEKFNELSSLQNNPDVVKAIINKISEVNEEPPLYINSPGNSTYQAIKKIINIKTAKAAAEATKKALE